MADQQPTEPQPTITDELSAYLDGELDAAGVRAVEERLARDPVYHQELQRLERAWDLLDRLPRAAVDDSFTKTTIEMVAVAAAEDAQQVLNELPRRQRRQRTIGAVAVLAVGLVGFFAGRWLWPNPNEQLLEDLPVIKNFELYYQADNLEFLRMLDSEGLFAEGENDHAG